jgi:3-oxoacyl-[acyl-carrier-protein] synthase-3
MAGFLYFRTNVLEYKNYMIEIRTWTGETRSVLVPKPNHNSELIRPGGEIMFEVILPPGRERVIDNNQVANWKLTAPDGKPLNADEVFRRTGIDRRYVAYDLDPLFMAKIAILHMFPRMREVPPPVDLTIASTSYPLGTNISAELNKEMGIDADNFDIYAACSGAGRGFDYVREYAREGQGILIVASEMHSSKVWNLREEGGVQGDPGLSQLLLSDGAVAMYFVYGKDLTILTSTTKDLGHPELITGPYDSALLTGRYIEEPAGTKVMISRRMQQQGKEMFMLVRTAIPDLIEKTVIGAGLKPSDIALVITHQPSIHLLRTMQKHLAQKGFDPEKFMYDMEDGNFSSASVLKALYRAMLEGRAKKGDKIVVATVGAGVTASVVIFDLKSGLF